jgi:NTE family protein
VGDEHRSLAEALADRVPLPPMAIQSLLRFRPPRLPVVASWLRQPWRVDPVLAVTSLLPDGAVDLLEHAGERAAALAGPWPEEDLWVCAVRQSDLRRVVFGRDAEAPLADAVAASCAIPGYFRPPEIDGEAFIDGGVRSPTNAAVLRGRDLDLVVILSPMSGTGLSRFHPSGAVRRYAKAKVDHEVRTLQEHGIPTVLIEPGAEASAVLGGDLMRDDNLPAVVTAGLLDTGDQLRKPGTRVLMHALGRMAG